MIRQKEITDATFERVVTTSESLADASRTLGMSTVQVTFRARLLGIHSKGYKKRRPGRATTADDVRAKYLSNEHAIQSSSLRVLLLKTGIKEHRCEYCGNTHWMDYPIPLELHHKNQDHHDNSEDNLMLLCPTCHALITQIDKFDKEKEKTLLKRKKQECDAFYREHGYPASEIHGVKFNIEAVDLIQLFRLHGSYRKVGQILGVSDNAVKKRCKKLGISDVIIPIVRENQRRSAALNRGSMTEEKKRKIGQALRKRNNGASSPQAKKVDKLDKITGEFIETYPSIRAAAKAVNAKEQNITNCCLGRTNSCKGFKWRYHDTATVM